MSKARILWLLAVAAGGCGSSESTATTPQGAVDIVETNQVAKAVLFAAADPFEPGSSNPAPAVAAAVNRFYLPPGCSSVIAGNNSVTYTFNGCKGPLGIVNVTGGVTVTYVPGGSGQTVLRTAGTNVSANNASVNLNVQASYVSAGGLRQLTINDFSTGRGSYGNQVSQVGNGTMTWQAGAPCTLFTGGGTMTVAGNAGNQTYDRNQLCADLCPQGNVTLTNGGTQTIVLSLDGTRTATFHQSNGTTGTIGIVCGP